MQTSSVLAETHSRLTADFPFYAKNALKIKTKHDSIEPMVLNRAQLYLHERLEAQLSSKGRVRALILKGRQQGCSTYTEARFFWKVTQRFGANAYILTHLDEATQNIFDMAMRFYEHHSYAKASRENAKELLFKELDSGYKVGTAGSKAAGRSQTIHYFHGSEVGFWPHADDHAAGVMQAIPDADGTEIVLESTANGVGNYFHQQWQRAEAGQSEYEAIFIPWYWQEEYSRDADGFDPTPEECEYEEAYGLKPEQLAWMRVKVAELGGWAKFNQEYPSTAALAFQLSGEDSFISPQVVTKARKCEAVPIGGKVGGLDVARFGADRSAFIIRQGRKAWGAKTWQGKDTMEMAGIAAKLIKEHDLQRLFVDVVGLGAGVVDRLREMGLSSKVTPVNGGEKPIEEDKYRNKRAEMWGEMKGWLNEPPVQIPDDDALHADLCGISYKYDSVSRLQMERKEDMKRRGLRSPDLADALAMTFAYPVMEKKPALVKIKTDWVK